jgi:periplasmic copper chaperone A
MTLKNLLSATALTLATLAAQAHEFKLGAITIGHPYARATAAGQSTGGGFMKLVNAGGADRLVSASADVSKSVELHMMKMEGDVMQMRQVDSIELAPGKIVELKPGGYHVMFIGLKAPLKVGDAFPMKLKFEKAGEVEVTVNVESPSAAMGGMKH